jgi:hypothetical protein
MGVRMKWFVGEDGEDGWELILTEGRRSLKIGVYEGSIDYIKRYEDGKNIGFNPNWSRLSGIHVLELIEWLHGSNEVYTL